MLNDALLALEACTQAGHDNEPGTDTLVESIAAHVLKKVCRVPREEAHMQAGHHGEPNHDTRAESITGHTFNDVYSKQHMLNKVLLALRPDTCRTDN